MIDELLESETKYYTLIKTFVANFLDPLALSRGTWGREAAKAVNIDKSLDFFSLIVSLSKEIL